MRIVKNKLIGVKSNGVEVTATIPEKLLIELISLLESVETPEELLKEIALEKANRDEAVFLKNLYPEWKPGLVLKEGERVKRPVNDGVFFFEVNKGQGHTTQVGWEPEIAHSLFTSLEGKIDIDDKGNPTGEHPQWVKPGHKETSYRLGAIVQHNDLIWINKGKDWNEYEPGVWGWEVIDD